MRFAVVVCCLLLSQQHVSARLLLLFPLARTLSCLLVYLAPDLFIGSYPLLLLVVYVPATSKPKAPFPLPPPPNACTVFSCLLAYPPPDFVHWPLPSQYFVVVVCWLLIYVLAACKRKTVTTVFPCLLIYPPPDFVHWPLPAQYFVVVVVVIAVVVVVVCWLFMS